MLLRSNLVEPKSSQQCLVNWPLISVEIQFVYWRHLLPVVQDIGAFFFTE